MARLRTDLESFKDEQIKGGLQFNGIKFDNEGISLIPGDMPPS